MRPRVIRIYSENNDFQYIDTLRRRREKRHRGKEFFVEGVRPINQALAHGWTINAFVYAPGRELSGWTRDILSRSRAARHYELPPALLEKLSNKNEPSELLALVAMPDDDLARIPIREGARIVIFDRPASPGNLGTLIRSCDALGVDGLVVSGHAADVYDPETISATTGSLFAVPVVRVPGPDALLPWLEEIRRQLRGLLVVGTDEKADRDVARQDLTGPVIVVVGNETWGLSARFKEMCDVMVSIPMTGSASSLNVACAASIILYEMDRQRRYRWHP